MILDGNLEQAHVRKTAPSLVRGVKGCHLMIMHPDVECYRRYIMRIDEIVTLSKAGFTAEQIAQMNAAQAQQAQQQPVQQPVQQPIQQPVQQPVQQQPVQPQQPQTPNPMDALMQQVMNLTNVVQANALGNTQMPTPENADDILAAIINPPEKKDKK